MFGLKALHQQLGTAAYASSSWPSWYRGRVSLALGKVPCRSLTVAALFPLPTQAAPTLHDLSWRHPPWNRNDHPFCSSDACAVGDNAHRLQHDTEMWPKLCSQPLKMWFWTSKTGLIGDLIRKADSWALPQSCWIRICNVILKWYVVHWQWEALIDG